MEFQAFPKIPRLKRGCVITEKLDGTNACVVVSEDGVVSAQSRSRVITPENDNYGFAKWVEAHAEDLRELGPGYHYGEWWGQDIQRRYGLEEKRFSLFNTGRWTDLHSEAVPHLPKQAAPLCCYVVPVLARGDLLGAIIDAERKLSQGSVAASGWAKPEGYVVFLHGHYFKVLLENDDVPKSLAAA